MSLEALRDFLRRERWQEQADGWENTFLEAGERVLNHSCLRPLTVREYSGDEIFLDCPENIARFREGDLVLVNPDGTPAERVRAGFEMEWVRFDPIRAEVVLARSFRTRREAFPFRGGQAVMLDQAPDSIQDAIAEMLAFHESDPARRAFLQSFLDGSLVSRDAEIEADCRRKVLSAWPLNAGQTAAFDRALTCYPISGVQGPPGTGKTRVLAALAAYYFLRGMDVLVSSVSHFAINHALNQCNAALSKLQKTGCVVKVSRLKNTGLDRGVLRVPRLKNLGDHRQGPIIAGMTPFKFPREFRPGDFRILLFDEASQAAMPLAAASMAFAKKTIFLGDHRQLGPIFLHAHHDPDGSRSAFAHLDLHYRGRTTLLTESYRLGSGLERFSSNAFYEGRLTPHPDRAEAVWNLPKGDLLTDDPVLDVKRASVFVSLSHFGCLKFSDEEAILVGSWLEKLVDGGAAPSQIAVLVPFRGQQNRIRREVHLLEQKRGWSLRGLVVDTVDRLQGQERDIIIYSLAMSDPARLAQIADFFFDPHRLNVALTRARFKRIVVGSARIFDTRVHALEALKGLDLLARFADENAVFG